MTDPSTNSLEIVKTICTFLSTCFVAVMSYLMIKQKASMTQVAKTLATSTASTDSKLNGLAVVADKTHVLVNSNFGLQLRVAAAALRRVATLTHADEDVKVADEAERILADHDAKQAIVDAKK